MLIYLMLARERKSESGVIKATSREKKKKANGVRKRKHYISYRGQEVNTEWERWVTLLNHT